jgi:two-component system, response regulator
MLKNMTVIVDILLVEDNADEAELTIRTLGKSNLAGNLLHLRDGEEAIDFLFSKDLVRFPKLVLLDLKMPKMDGIDVLRKIKSDPVKKVIPVVMLTSSSEERDLFQSYMVGVNAYIVKPVNTQNFMKTVTDVGLFWLTLNNQWPG